MGEKSYLMLRLPQRRNNSLIFTYLAFEAIVSFVSHQLWSNDSSSFVWFMLRFYDFDSRLGEIGYLSKSTVGERSITHSDKTRVYMIYICCDFPLCDS